MRKLLKNYLSVTGLIIIMIFFLAQALAPSIAPYDPTMMEPGNLLAPPTSHNPLGTDGYGRDIMSRLLYGGRVSFVVSILSTLVALLFGTATGLLAGFFGGWVDTVLMRIMDIILAFPALLLAICIMAVLGQSNLNIVLAIGVVYIPQFARLTRGSVLAVRDLEFVEAVRALGARSPRIIVRHIVPNILPSLLVQVSLTISLAVLYESALSFLGLGAQPPTPSWGNMLSESRRYMELAPWTAVAPGAAIMLVVLGFNLLGDGLRDVLDPRLRGRI
ncbi:MAG: ABC transporter permease [Firmicutes bacterium]|nr:ABC transporter permease [Bacillota bacterium]